MAAGRFDAVFLDFYGTVCAGDRAIVAAACRRIVEAFRLPVSAEQFAVAWGERFFATVDQCNHDSFQTLYECECSSLKQTLAPWVADVDPEPFVEILEAYWRDPPLHDDARELLARLKLPVCCVSNADSLPLASALERRGLRFDAVVCSQHARCYKPEAAIFEQAAAALRVDPRRVLHVGDSLHSDVGGAAPLGITTAWLCREERIHDIGTARPDHTIGTLRAVLDLINIA